MDGTERTPPASGKGEPPPPCMIYIDLEGKWYHKGAEIIRMDMIRLFCENMILDQAGRHVIIWDGKPCRLDVEDTAYVVRSVTCIRKEGVEGGRFLLELNDGSTESLKPETLRLKADHVPYCQVRNGVFPARFTRQAYYQLAHYVIDDGGDFYLPVEGKRYPL